VHVVVFSLWLAVLVMLLLLFGMLLYIVIKSRSEVGDWEGGSEEGHGIEAERRVLGLCYGLVSLLCVSHCLLCLYLHIEPLCVFLITSTWWGYNPIPDVPI